MPSSPLVVSEWIVDAHSCRADLSDAVALERVARLAVESVGAHVAASACHRFQPHGLTLCLILMESHFVISTWPEHDLAIVNLFLCNPAMDPEICWKVMAAHLEPQNVTIHKVPHRLGRLIRAA